MDIPLSCRAQIVPVLIRYWGATMDLTLMLVSTAGGFFHVDWYLVLIVGIALTLIGADRNFLFARQNSDVGTARVFMIGAGAHLVNNLAFAALTFLAGRAFAWLIFG